MVNQLVEHFNVVDHPILNNHSFLKQFPKFSVEYANKFSAYKEISNDNKVFMDDYQNHSIFKKVPQTYQKLMHNYGTVDFKDLDPKISNLFSTAPSTRGTTRKTMTRGGSQGQFSNAFFSPKKGQFEGRSLFGQTQSIGFLAPINFRQCNNIPINPQTLKEDIINSQDSKPRTAQENVVRQIQFEKFQPSQDDILSPKSHATIPIMNLQVEENEDGRQSAAPPYHPQDPEYGLYNNIQQLKRIITHAYKTLRQYQIDQNKPKSPKGFLSISLEEIERMRHFEETQIKLLEAAVQLQLRDQLIQERHEQQEDKKETQEIHHKLLSKKLQRSDSYKMPFYKQQTLVGFPLSDTSNNDNRYSKNIMNLNFTQGVQNVQQQRKSIFQQDQQGTQTFPTSSSSKNRQSILPHHIYTKEELLFHELQKMITKLTCIKSYDLSFQEKFKSIEVLKSKTTMLKKLIDRRGEDEEKSIIKLSHTKFVDDMIAQLEQHYHTQLINQSKKRIQRESLKTQLMELEARENQLRNTDFKYKKFYQKNMHDLQEMKDYLKEIKERIKQHYEYLNSQQSQTNADTLSSQRIILNQTKQQKIGNLQIANQSDNIKKNVRFLGSNMQMIEEEGSKHNSKFIVSKIDSQQLSHNISKDSEEIKLDFGLRYRQGTGLDSRSSMRSVNFSPHMPYNKPLHGRKMQKHPATQELINEEIENIQSVSGPTENQSQRQIEEEDDEFQSDTDNLSAEMHHQIINPDDKIVTRYKDFENITDMIKEFFNPISQNKQLLQNSQSNPTIARLKSQKSKQNLNSLNPKEMQLIQDLSKLEMREICKADELQKLLSKATSQNRDENKYVVHQYTMLKKQLQKKLKYQDLEKLKQLTQQIMLDQNDISLTSASKSIDSRQKNRMVNSKSALEINNNLGNNTKSTFANATSKQSQQKPIMKTGKKNEPMNFTNMLLHNMYGVQQLRMHANEYGIVEKLEEYSKKHGVYDDGIKEHINKIKNYKSNLELIDKKLIQIAANHLNL